MFGAVNAEVESPGRLQGIRSIKYEEKNRSREALKRGDRCKKMNEKSTVYFRWAFIYNWFDHTEMINLFYQNLTFSLGVNSCLVMFSQKNILHGFLFSFRF